MVGVITGRHVALHPVLIVHEFGWRVLLRCVKAVVTRKQATFLSML